MQNLDDKIVQEFGVVQNFGFESFSRITAIRKDSKNRKSGSVSLLTNYCSCCFSIVADNVILATATNETKFRIKVFGAAFFKKRAVLWLVLQVIDDYVQQKGEVVSAIADRGCDDMAERVDNKAAWDVLCCVE